MPDDNFLPVIDLAAARLGDSHETGRQIADAFTRSGFCYVRNHGIAQAVIDRVRSEALDFFHLPEAEKLKCKPTEAVRGFNALNRTTMYGAANPDYKEFYQIGLELTDEQRASLQGQAMRGPNRWPEGRPDFRQAFLDYFAAVAACGQVLLRSVACSLGIDPDFFQSRYGVPLQRTQAIWYPPHPADAVETFGVAPHTDYGCITLLWQDGTGGLDVQGPDGEWVAAPPIPGTLVINIGDLLCRWSNQRYHSNMHRVTNRSGKERISIATFYDPDYVAMVDPRDLNLPSGIEPMFAPVSAGDYIIGRIQDSQRRPATAS